MAIKNTAEEKKTLKFYNYNIYVSSTSHEMIIDCQWTKCLPLKSTALHSLLMMTAEFMLSKRSVLGITAVLLFFFALISSHVYCIA